MATLSIHSPHHPPVAAEPRDALLSGSAHHRAGAQCRTCPGQPQSRRGAKGSFCRQPRLWRGLHFGTGRHSDSEVNSSAFLLEASGSPVNHSAGTADPNPSLGFTIGSLRLGSDAHASLSSPVWSRGPELVSSCAVAACLQA